MAYLKCPLCELCGFLADFALIAFLFNARGAKDFAKSARDFFFAISAYALRALRLLDFYLTQGAQSSTQGAQRFSQRAQEIFSLRSLRMLCELCVY